MDNKEIRKNNLELLILEFGTVAALCKKADVSASNISQIRTDVKLPSGSPRGMGHKLARRLEVAAGKQPGWMDVYHEKLAPSELYKPEHLNYDEVDQDLLDKIIAATMDEIDKNDLETVSFERKKAVIGLTYKEYVNTSKIINRQKIIDLLKLP